MLELTNMIQQDRDYIWLNKDEEKSIKIFIKHLEEPYFEISKYNLFDQTDKKQMYSDWAKYYSTLNAELASIATDFTSTSDIADKSDLVMQRGTVGLSTGITQILSTGGKLIIIFTMFFGRIGPLALASLWVWKKDVSYKYTEENISIG